MQRRSFLAGLVAALTPQFARADDRPNKEVLAFYYGWYGPDAHWATPGALHTPVNGRYDSQDPAVIRRQIAMMKDAGITGLIASWWGKDDPTDRQLALLLEAASDAGIKVCAYVENVASPAVLAEQLLYLHASYAAEPAWLLLKGKPVVFLYDRVLQTIGLDGWQAARAIVEKAAPGAFATIATGNGRGQIEERAPYFDGLHIYDMAYYLAQKHNFAWQWRWQFYDSWVKNQKGLSVTTATIMPGFDDHIIAGRPLPRPFVDRDGGELFRNLWRAAIRANPDWILIVSFNEWHEGTEIEPSQENGSRELQTCKEMSKPFLRNTLG